MTDPQVSSSQISLSNIRQFYISGRSLSVPVLSGKSNLADEDAVILDRSYLDWSSADPVDPEYNLRCLRNVDCVLSAYFQSVPYPQSMKPVPSLRRHTRKRSEAWAQDDLMSDLQWRASSVLGIVTSSMIGQSRFNLVNKFSEDFENDEKQLAEIIGSLKALRLSLSRLSFAAKEALSVHGRANWEKDEPRNTSSKLYEVFESDNIERLIDTVQCASDAVEVSDKLPSRSTDYHAISTAEACRSFWRTQTGEDAPRVINSVTISRFGKFLGDLLVGVGIETDARTALRNLKRIEDAGQFSMIPKYSQR